MIKEKHYSDKFVFPMFNILIPTVQFKFILGSSFTCCSDSNLTTNLKPKRTNIYTVGIRLPAIQLPEPSSYRTFSNPLTEWSIETSMDH